MADHVTNLPMELLFKMKLEEKIAKQMLKEGKINNDGIEVPTLSSQPAMEGGATIGSQQVAKQGSSGQ